VVRPIPGFETDGVHVVNSDHILELKDVPKSLIVMGAGAVGCEFASVYSRFGAETTIVELLPRLVPLEDEEVSKELEKSFRKRGIKSQLDTRLEKLEKTETGVRVSGKTAKGEAVSLEAEMLLVAVGRMPFTEGLGLEGSKIKLNEDLFRSMNINKPARRVFMRSATWCRRRYSRTWRRKKALLPLSTSPDRRTCDRSIFVWCQTVPIAIRKLLQSD